jgi:hypothetical protein
MSRRAYVRMLRQRANVLVLIGCQRIGVVGSSVSFSPVRGRPPGVPQRSDQGRRNRTNTPEQRCVDLEQV